MDWRYLLTSLAMASLLVAGAVVCADETGAESATATATVDSESPEPATDAHDEAHHEHEGADHAGHSDHGGHGGGPNPLAVNPDLAVWTGVVFFVLLTVLGKFAWGPIIAALEKREQGIAGDLAAAEQKHQEAKDLLGQHQVKLSQAADEVREMLEEARRDAEQTKADILTEAKAAAQAEHDRAMRDVRNAKDAALKEIGESGANFAIQLAGKIVEKELQTDDHTRLIRDAVAKFPSQN